MAKDKIERKFFNTNCSADIDMHNFNNIKKTLLCFRGQDRHANLLQCYVLRALHFLFHIIKPKGQFPFFGIALK